MHVYLRGSFEQKLRLFSGLILFVFAATHFLNHALGLVSLEVMHDAQRLRTTFTRSTAGTLVLGAALFTHITLALLKLSRRKTWRMPRWEAVQILLGLAIPFFLFPHIVNTRIAHQYFKVEDIYLYELMRLWPDSAVVQTLLLLTVWGHGCLGLHYWLRLSDGYRRAAPILLVIALAVPALAFAGFAVGGRTVGDIMQDPAAFAALKARTNWPSAEDGAALAWLRVGARIVFYAMVVGVVALALSRQLSRKMLRKRVRVHFVDGPTIEATPEKTLLELSREAGIPHASVCGGRGRCSTCRVRIEKGRDRLPAPMGAEAVTLASIGAPTNIRLACQIRPIADLSVVIVSRPAVPGPPQEGFADISEVVAAHIRGVAGDHLVDVLSHDPATVEDWLRNRGQKTGPLQDLAATGFELQGARIEYLADLPKAAIIYKRSGHLVTLFQSPIDDTAPLAMRGRHNGYFVRTLSTGQFTCVFVSDLPQQELDLLEEALRPEEAELKIDSQAAIQ
ncbi:MAG: 2Fe-2S iron-sulfur cluster-binding protein [Hyphomicrobiaceae bacterium]